MDLLYSLLPDGVYWWQALLVVVIAGFASALTAALGIGGGLILLAVMSVLLPVAAVIPVHGVAQLGSNTGRVLMQFRYVVWQIFFWFTLGGLLGIVLGTQVLVTIPVWLLKLGVASFVLISVWGPKVRVSQPSVGTFFATGAVGAFLTLFFGATGPLAATVLRQADISRFAMVTTHGACMVAQHLMKVIAFGALGFAYAPWLPLLLGIVGSGFLGTWVGLKVLHKMPEDKFKLGFKMALTIIALYLLVSAIADWLQT